MDNANLLEQAKALAHRLAEREKSYEKNGFPVIAKCYDKYDHLKDRLKKSKVVTKIDNKYNFSEKWATLSAIDKNLTDIESGLSQVGGLYDAMVESTGLNPLKKLGVDPTNKTNPTKLKDALEKGELHKIAKEAVKDKIAKATIEAVAPALIAWGVPALWAGVLVGAGTLVTTGYTLEKHRRERLKKQQEKESKETKTDAGEVPGASGSSPGRNAKNMDASAAHSLNGGHAASNISNGDVTVANIQKRVSNVIAEITESRQGLAKLVYDVQARRDELDSILEGDDSSLIMRAQQSYENAVSALEDDVLPRLTQIKSLLDDYIHTI